MAADTRSVANLSRPLFEKKRQSGTKLLTIHLLDFYKKCFPLYKYDASMKPQRILTEVPENCFEFFNNGHDLPNGDYIIKKDDIIISPEGTEYLIEELIGKGTFGQVVKCKNRANNERVAIKVLKNKRTYRNQGSVEIKILHILNTMDDMNDNHIVQMHDYFVFREHLCIVFELLSYSLYDLIAKNNFTGLSLNLSRLLISQILESLILTKQAGLIHCDLKPENILLCSQKSTSLKVIDFGSACFDGHTVYTYIQSRYYRSPEVIMGLQYSTAIDIWSLGCICVELFRGIPLFPGNCEYNQLRLIINLLGLPPKDMIEQSRHGHKYFAPVYENSGEYSYRFKAKHEFEAEQGVFVPDINFEEDLTCLDDLIRFQNTKNDKLETKECFVDFLKGILHIDPRRRWTPNMGRQHPFISRKKYEGPFVPKREESPMYSSHSIDERDENSDSSSVSRRNKSDEMYEKMGSCPSQLLRDPPDNIFNKFAKKGIPPEKMHEMFNNKSYRPPILSLEVDYFKGFNFNSLDSISEGFKDMIYNQRKYS